MKINGVYSFVIALFSIFLRFMVLFCNRSSFLLLNNIPQFVHPFSPMLCDDLGGWDAGWDGDGREAQAGEEYMYIYG